MSNTQKKNVPELRFPEFEGEWEEKQLGNIIKVNSGKDYKHLDKGDIPVYGTGGYMTSVSEPLSEIDAVGIGRKGTINKPYLLEAPFWTVDTLFYCTPKKETEILFILSLFRKINWKVYDESTGVPSLSKQTINKINRFVPTNKEQQKIGKFFSKLDRQIELEEQKLELLQQQKKGYMQKIFSQELRFKDENGNDYPDWTNERLGEVTTVTMGQSPKSVNYTDNSNDTVLIQGNADIENGLINPRIYTREVTKLIQKDEIILTVRAPVGKLAMAQINACIGRGVCSIKGDKFLYYFLEWFATQNKWIRFSQGSTFESISGNDIRNIHIKIPVEDERTKIIKLLNSLDVLNSKTDLKIQNLKQRKQSLLQKIFV
ncbi:TPA: restriction endonuclease subunit S [Staphylococcus aureus]|nr:restriction endonuclease subunit S [Staphylococcus aureus]